MLPFSREYSCISSRFARSLRARSNMLLALLSCLSFAISSFAASLPRQVASHSPCRFAPLYTQEQIFHNSSSFIADIFYWDGQITQNGVGMNTQNGLTFDGCILNQTTGLANISERHDFSAPSKEASNSGSPTEQTLIAHRLCKS